MFLYPIERTEADAEVCDSLPGGENSVFVLLHIRRTLLDSVLVATKFNLGIMVDIVWADLG